MSISQLKRALDQWEHGYFLGISKLAPYEADYKTIRDKLLEKARNDPVWVQKYLIDSAKWYVISYSRLRHTDTFLASLQVLMSSDCK